MTTLRRKREECEHEGSQATRWRWTPDILRQETSSPEIGIIANNGDDGLPLDYG